MPAADLDETVTVLKERAGREFRFARDFPKGRHIQERTHSGRRHCAASCAIKSTSLAIFKLSVAGVSQASSVTAVIELTRSSSRRPLKL
jgi:hypothetical protein